MAVISNQRTTGNVASHQRAIDISKPILLLEPSATPLTVLSKRIQNGGNVKAADDYLYKWSEDEREVRFDAVNAEAGYTAEATEVIVDTPSVFYAAALVKVPRTGEILFVSSISENTLTVKRGFSGTTAAALVNNDPLFVIGAVAEEGDTSFAARSENPDEITNYLQIFRTSIEASESWRSSANMTSPHDWVHQHKKKNIEHLLDIEHALLFGGKATTTGANGRRVSTTGGILSFYTSNNQDAGGTLTEAEFETFVRTICRYGSNTKTLLASPLLVSVINQYAVGKLQTIQADNDTTFGLKIMNYVSPHGEVKIVKHNLLEGAVWGGYGIAFDAKAAPPVYRYLAGKGAPGGSRDTKLLTQRQANDADTQKDEILTEAGGQFPQPKTGGVLTGVTG